MRVARSVYETSSLPALVRMLYKLEGSRKFGGIYIYFLDFFLTTSTKVTSVRNCLLITIYSIENGVSREFT